MRTTTRLPLLRPARGWVVAAALGLAGCGPKVHVEPSPFERDDPAAGAAVRAPAGDPLPEAPPAPGARTGAVDRAAVLAVLDAGPGPLLSTFEVTAETEGERFVGWRLLSLDRARHRFAGVDLAPGDVLVSLNGRALSRPDELSAVWEGLRTAEAIVAELRRDGGRVQLRWEIVDAPPAP